MNDKGLADRRPWLEAGFALPEFDREAMRTQTMAAPQWVHFGAGNIFRAFPAMLQQQLLNEGLTDRGIVVAEGYDMEILDLVNIPHDDLSLLVTLKADGSVERTVVGSVAASLKADSTDPTAWNQLQEIFAAPSLQMASFTITEKGYSLIRGDGGLLPDVAADLDAGPSQPDSYMGKVAALLHHRWQSGGHPLALVSMDNCSHNGTRLYDAVHRFAQVWVIGGKAERGFLKWIKDPSKVSFPWTMIDKITPRPDESVRALLEAAGFEGSQGRVTAKNTYVAPFVNAEETQYLVIQDSFPNGRPPLDKVGVLFTDRDTVDKVEKMKVCTCLNPLHTALAIFGCLLGYHKISDEMQDELLVKLIQRIGYREGLPVVVDPEVLSPKAFIDTVIQLRFPNPFMPDTPQRIATDSSQKLAIRFGETVAAYLQRPDLRVDDLVAIPLVYAGWCRYLVGVDDQGRAFDPSPDPLLAEMQAIFQDLKLGKGEDVHHLLQPLLSRADIFGADLYQAGLGQRVEGYFAEMLAGPGAVRNVLKKHLV